MRYTPIRAMKAINEVFLNLPRGEVKTLLARQRPLSIKHGLSMFTPQGTPRLIDVHLRPWLVNAAQRRFFYQASMTIKRALARLMPLYVTDASVRKIVPLEPLEQEWLLEVNAQRLQKPQTIIDRLDMTATFATADWQENFWFLEPNSVGIGGVHYIPATCALTSEWILPLLKRELPELHVAFHDDIRQLILKSFIRHAKALGIKLKRVALVEDCSVAGGTDEFTCVAGYFSRQGLPAFAADPRDVCVRNGGLTVRGKPVDLVYRDTEMTELLEMEREKAGSVDGMKEAFIRNRVISSIGGEFDHKSAWELFTNPEFAQYFTRKQRRLFKKHLLWTRLLWERRTTDLRGKVVDLVSFSKRHREKLVIKPNRAYGGEGVVFGHEVTQSVWERELAEALKRPRTYVIQQAVPVHSELFPVASGDGTVRLKPFYAVTGCAATPDGVAFLGRASRESVVNVSRKGGLIAVWRLGWNG